MARRPFDWRRLAPLAALLAALALVFAFGLDRYVSLEALGAHRASLVAWTQAHPMLAALACMAIAAALMAMAFPSIGVAMAAAGLVFGLWQGFALTLSGATAGGLVLFLAARGARDGIMATRAGPLLQRLEDGAQGNGFLYLLSLRLMPIFPTTAVTLAAAAARLPARDFVPATLLGSAPASFIFTSVGAGMGGVLDDGGELSLWRALLNPQVLAPLAALAALALLSALIRAQGRRAKRG